MDPAMDVDTSSRRLRRLGAHAARVVLTAASVLTCALALPVPVDAQTPAERWATALAEFDAADQRTPPVPGGVLFLGSSTVAAWDTARSFPGVRVINRGVWSSYLADFARNVDRLVLPYAPRLIVVYAGDNDINAGSTSEQVAIEFERFVYAVHAKLPQTRIAFIGIKPSPARWTQVYRMRLANALVRDFVERDDRLAFIDVDGPMLGWNEQPRKELFVTDGLHLSPAGFELWSILVRPFLAP